MHKATPPKTAKNSKNQQKIAKICTKSAFSKRRTNYTSTEPLCILHKSATQIPPCAICQLAILHKLCTICACCTKEKPHIHKHIRPSDAAHPFIRNYIVSN